MAPTFTDLAFNIASSMGDTTVFLGQFITGKLADGVVAMRAII